METETIIVDIDDYVRTTVFSAGSILPKDAPVPLCIYVESPHDRDFYARFFGQDPSLFVALADKLVSQNPSSRSSHIRFVFREHPINVGKEVVVSSLISWNDFRAATGRTTLNLAGIVDKDFGVKNPLNLEELCEQNNLFATDRHDIETTICHYHPNACRNVLSRFLIDGTTDEFRVYLATADLFAFQFGLFKKYCFSSLLDQDAGGDKDVVFLLRHLVTVCHDEDIQNFSQKFPPDQDCRFGFDGFIGSSGFSLQRFFRFFTAWYVYVRERDDTASSPLSKDSQDALTILDQGGTLATPNLGAAFSQILVGFNRFLQQESIRETDGQTFAMGAQNGFSDVASRLPIDGERCARYPEFAAYFYDIVNGHDIAFFFEYVLLKNGKKNVLAAKNQMFEEQLKREVSPAKRGDALIHSELALNLKRLLALGK